MNFTDVLKSALPIIEKSAPILASAIGSPLSGIGANFAVSLLSNAFNIKPSDIHHLADSINNDPSACDKLCQVEENFKHWMPNNFHMPSVAEINVKLIWGNKII